MSKTGEAEFRRIYSMLAIKGKLVKPRGQLVLEIENFSYTLPAFARFPSFKCRKLNVKYIKSEMLWYIKGDQYDTSIADKAKIWQDIINRDGTINSNYGQYIFAGPNQFDNVVKILTEDKDSRRASMMILQDEHLLSDTKDVPCTYALNFRIRENKLNMSVHMRSQDAIYGMGNDAPAFSFMHEMMFNALLRVYPDLQCGEYFHIADSFHVYERHFKMLEEITAIDVMTKQFVKERDDIFEKIECPRVSGPDEVDFIRKLDFSTIPDEFVFAKWLTT